MIPTVDFGKVAERESLTQTRMIPTVDFGKVAEREIDTYDTDCRLR